MLIVHTDVLCCGTPATGEVTIEVPEGEWTYLIAKDEQHTLSGVAGLSVVDLNYYQADAVLHLRGGDTDSNDIVDIDDVTWLISTFGDPMDGGTHPWDGTRDADFSTDGFVGTEDYAFLVSNWLATGDAGAVRAGAVIPDHRVGNLRQVDREPHAAEAVP